MNNKQYSSEDVHVMKDHSDWLSGKFNEKVNSMAKYGWSVETMTPYEGQEWDYPKYRPTIGYNIIFSKGK